MRIVVIGGHGKIALRLSEQLSARGAHVTGTIRNPEHAADLTATGAEPAVVDLERDDIDRLAEVVRGADVVVFSAGAGADGKVERKRTVDYQGAVRSMAAAEQAGVRRFVQVSAIGVDNPVAEDAEPVWAAYVQAKRDADARLRESSLDWTILRPGRLTDDGPTGKVTMGPTVERADIPRADVAAVIVAVLDDPRTIGRQWELVGGDQPIARTIDALV